MRHTKAKIEKLVEGIREANSPGVVCDSVFECDGWQHYYPRGKNLCKTFIYCPWCGKEIHKTKKGDA